MPSARLLNEVNKIRKSELQIYRPSFVVSIELLLQTTFRLHKARVCPNGFGVTFAAMFVQIYGLKEFPLSAVTNCFQLRCESKQLMLLHHKFFPCCSQFRYFITPPQLLNLFSLIGCPQDGY